MLILLDTIHFPYYFIMWNKHCGFLIKSVFGVFTDTDGSFLFNVLEQGEGNGSQQEKKGPLLPCYSHSNLKAGFFFCCCCSIMLCNYWFEWFCRLKIKFLIEYKWVWKISNWQSFSLLKFIRVGMFPNWRSCNITISF